MAALKSSDFQDGLWKKLDFALKTPKNVKQFESFTKAIKLMLQFT